MASNRNGNSKILAERIINIERTLAHIDKKLDEITNRQIANDCKLAALEERTETLKYFVYTAVILAIGAIVSIILKILGG